MDTTARIALSMAERRDGGTIAFENIVSRYDRFVLHTALRHLKNREDAQDVAQEAFLRLHRSLHLIHDPRECGPWLYRVTVNLCNDHIRRKGSREVPLGEFDRPSGGLNPEAEVLLDERTRAMSKALEVLTDKERSALLLREVDGLSTREVAEMLGSTEQTVRSQICMARIKLRKLTERFFRR